MWQNGHVKYPTMLSELETYASMCIDNAKSCCTRLSLASKVRNFNVYIIEMQYFDLKQVALWYRTEINALMCFNDSSCNNQSCFNNLANLISVLINWNENNNFWNNTICHLRMRTFVLSAYRRGNEIIIRADLFSHNFITKIKRLT